MIHSVQRCCVCRGESLTDNSLQAQTMEEITNMSLICIGDDVGELLMCNDDASNKSFPASLFNCW